MTRMTRVTMTGYDDDYDIGLGRLWDVVVVEQRVGTVTGLASAIDKTRGGARVEVMSLDPLQLEPGAVMGRWGDGDGLRELWELSTFWHVYWLAGQQEQAADG